VNGSMLTETRIEFAPRRSRKLDAGPASRSHCDSECGMRVVGSPVRHGLLHLHRGNRQSNVLLSQVERLEIAGFVENPYALGNLNGLSMTYQKRIGAFWCRQSSIGNRLGRARSFFGPLRSWLRICYLLCGAHQFACLLPRSFALRSGRAGLDDVADYRQVPTSRGWAFANGCHGLILARQPSAEYPFQA